MTLQMQMIRALENLILENAETSKDSHLAKSINVKLYGS